MYAIVELRDAAGRARENLEADFRDGIVGGRRLVIRRQLAPAAREIGVDLRLLDKGQQPARIGLVLRFRRNQQHVHRTIFGNRHAGVDDREAERSLSAA